MFLVDILNILPVEVDCYIQAPSLEDIDILDMMNDTVYGYYQCLHINYDNKNFIIDKFQKETIVEYFNSIEIKEGKKLLFEGFDGIESGTISKTVNIPNWFKEKYKEDWTYSISKEW